MIFLLRIHGKQFILQKCQCKLNRKYLKPYNNMLLCFAAIFTRIHVKSKSVQGTQLFAGTAF